ncbi:MAG: N-acetylmuramoyl-L-alanine amidase [Alphaproteobacteria bacterium CG_4_9_14_3_um_filter_47_13]|nr:MAG: N-acetylmuramoyl-L-alanine amidase [Alphaproteobacteria bacterium CG_4_9_14_3_um_filter_47_13]
MNILQKPSEHYNDRQNGAKPSYIILHYTETRTLQEAEGYFLGCREHPGGGRVSTHYMIDEDGTIIQYVNERHRAWHAGVSYWAGNDDMNVRAVGIELVNPGRKYGYRAFPARQMEALVRLCKDIMARNGIAASRVLGHSDVAPSRKSDPGELFDWEMMAGAGIGVFPKPEAEDRKVAGDYLRDEQFLKEAFIKIGYDPKAALPELILAFQRHYYREAFGDQDNTLPGRMNEAAAARLHWLVRNRTDL